MFKTIFFISILVAVSASYVYLVLYRGYTREIFLNTTAIGILIGFGISASIFLGYLVFVVFFSATILASYYIIKFLPFSRTHEKYVVILIVGGFTGFCGSLACLCCILTI